MPDSTRTASARHQSRVTGKRGRPKAGTPRKHFVPPKPYPGFPLTPHASGKYMRRINGQLFYFGRWGRTVDGKMVRLPKDGWEDALAIYKAQCDDLYAGREPHSERADTNGQAVTSGNMNLAGLCNNFLLFKLGRMNTGELTARTFHDYVKMTDLLVEFWGRLKDVDKLTPNDFEQLRIRLAKYSPTRFSNLVIWIRGVFKHSDKMALVPKTFTKPSQKLIGRP
jgi:hypothetical protein